ncbi:lasso peptide biosynthesis B2 protein [Sphingobium sp. Sx8-8]|uniref:lasso peptide biosynthesis B2 protein n=1 Tax=Sphingobium sp. Sx8-8 TaxID=2933617 RepID=UPI001F599666|nr:lasso peptide biosynthesis B2 protein [Sphingobium sp. Sx8-8]
MFALTPGLHACIVGESPVLLNEASGRYMLLRGQTARNLHAFLSGASNEEENVALLASGLIVRSTHPSVQPPEVPKPVSTYLNAEGARCSTTMLIRALAALRCARRFIRRHPLRDILAHQRAIHGNRDCADNSAVALEGTIAATFHVIQRILPSTTQCFPRSIAIAALLRNFGCNPTLVIGVQLPISAHCWVQCDDRVIGDTLDRVTAFQPIWAT